MTYLIAFQGRAYKYDYSPLIDKIKSMGDYIQGMDSLWFIRTDMDLKDIVKELNVLITHEDLLFVTELPKDAKKDGYLLKTTWEFLKDIN